MNIFCNAVTISHNSLSDKRLAVHCEEVRADLVLQEVIDLKGAEFVLQAIGEKVILNHLASLGYVEFKYKAKAA